MTQLLSRNRAWVFRITDVRNIAWMLRNGLHSGTSGASDPDYVSIGNQDLIQNRASRCVPITPHGTLADYIPFYFTPYSIMMYKITTGHHGTPRRSNSKIAILVSSLRKAAENGVRFVFTDRHAYTKTARFFRR
jgi:hypothetical protein